MNCEIYPLKQWKARTGMILHQEDHEFKVKFSCLINCLEARYNVRVWVFPETLFILRKILLFITTMSCCLLCVVIHVRMSHIFCSAVTQLLYIRCASGLWNYFSEFHSEITVISFYKNLFDFIHEKECEVYFKFCGSVKSGVFQASNNLLWI